MPTITVTDVGGGCYRMECSCGEAVTFAGKAFTDVEAMRHTRWHRKATR